jgi:hypothetical protein
MKARLNFKGTREDIVKARENDGHACFDLSFCAY